MIEAKGLTKRYGAVTAVRDLNFTVREGMVTGFLGRNGAGKSTTMQMIVGLQQPTSGTVTVNGKRYRDAGAPLHELGALLDAKAVHPGMTARDHLRCLATSNGIPRSRVDEVLDLVGLTHVARRRAGTFSLGMGQRLGIAAALLGDPPIVMLDEPLNGLDPDGVHWLREFLRGLADQGRTVFLSSHLMAEMALIADRLIVLDHGALVTDSTLDDLVRQHSATVVRARVDDPMERMRLAAALHGCDVANEGSTLTVTGITTAEVGRRARDAGIALTELRDEADTLEDVFMQITRSVV